MIWIFTLASALAADRLTIDALCGDIHVEGGAKTTTIDGKPPPGNRLLLGVDAGCGTVQVRVPDGLALKLETVSASVVLDGVTGRVDFESASGSLSTVGKVQPKRLDASSVSGVLEVVMAKGSEAELQTVSGAINVSGGPASRLECSSVSGRITVAATWQPNAFVELNSHSGKLRIHLKEAPSSLQTTSFAGKVHNPFADARSNAGPQLEIETFSADIHIDDGE